MFQMWLLRSRDKMNQANTWEGKISTFGGPEDMGVAPEEGLALINEGDLREWWFRRLFLDHYPIGTTGLARRLNPLAFYIAMRWEDHGVGREIARRAIFKLTNPVNDKHVFAQGADFGPALWTRRLVDMSPGCAQRLNLVTNEVVKVEMIV